MANSKEARFDVFGDISVATRSLSRRDKVLKKCLKQIGDPVIRRRDGGFEGLFRIIVEQQVSVPSAQAVWGRCCAGMKARSAKDVLAIGDEMLKSFGLSGPKIRYISGIAAAIDGHGFSLNDVGMLSNDDAMDALMALKGIGPWSAAIYLLFCEGRVDIWPAKDVALKHSFNAASGENFDQDTFDKYAADWVPYRGVAAHILWTYYAHLKGRAPI